VEFLIKQANSINLVVNIYHLHPQIPIVILTWVGKEPKQQSILLNSHMDLVPAYEVSALIYGKDAANVCCCLYSYC